MHKYLIFLLSLVIALALFSCEDFFQTYEQETFEIDEIDDIGVGAIAGSYPDALIQFNVWQDSTGKFCFLNSDKDTLDYLTLDSLYNYIDTLDLGLGHRIEEATFRQVKGIDISYLLFIEYSNPSDGSVLETDTVSFDHGPIAYDSTDYVKTIPDGQGGDIVPTITFTEGFEIASEQVDSLGFDEVESAVNSLNSQFWVDSIFVSEPKYNYNFRIMGSKDGYCTVYKSESAGKLNVYLNSYIDFYLISTTSAEPDTIAPTINDQIPLEALVEYYTIEDDKPETVLKTKLTFDVNPDNYLIWVRKIDQTTNTNIYVSLVRE